MDFDPIWLGYGALLSLLAASLATRMDAMRLGLAVAAGLALAAAVLAGRDIGLVLLLGIIFAINAALLARLWLRDAAVRFTPEEQALRRLHFDTLSQAEARRLIDQGHWVSARRGEVLIREDQAVPSLFYLARGAAAIHREGVEVGLLSDGALIGEATVIDGSNATGTVSLKEDTRLWFVPAAALRTYLTANPDIAAALHEGFARALRGKLASANTRLSEKAPLS